MENEVKETENIWKDYEKKHKRGKIVSGILVVIIGCLFLARELGVLIPASLLTWKMLIVGIAIAIIIKNNFKTTKGFLLLLVGLAFLISDFYPQLAIKAFIWPLLVIAFGLIIIFKPRKNHHPRFGKRFRRRGYGNHRQWIDEEEEQIVSADKIEINTVMSAVKKSMISKNFKGGYIQNELGSSEVNLLQADFEGTVVLEINVRMGGVELTIPANWEIQPELDLVMGNVEDNRPVQATDKNKILILRGNVFMGNIEIKSF